MIKVNTLGRLGNNLFQYATGRILAEALNYRLEVKTFPQFKNMTEIRGVEVSEPVVTINYVISTTAPGGCCDPDYTLDGLIKCAPCKFVFNTFCVKPSFLEPYKDKIREWFDIPNGFSPHQDDIVLHVRLTDFIKLGWDLREAHYLRILNNQTWKQKYLCTDDASHPLIRKLQRVGCQVVPGDEFETFKFIKSFNNIVIASTFSWWAAFLSRATRIYIPSKVHFWSTKSIDFRINESRYIYV